MITKVIHSLVAMDLVAIGLMFVSIGLISLSIYGLAKLSYFLGIYVFDQITQLISFIKTKIYKEPSLEEPIEVPEEEEVVFEIDVEEASSIPETPEIFNAQDAKKLKAAGYRLTALYIKDYTHDKNLSLQDFIIYILKNSSIDIITTYEDGVKQSRPAYRSLGDILRIVLPLYPSATRRQVKDILINTHDLVGHLCPDINRRVYCHKETRPQWGLRGTTALDEFDEVLFDKNSSECAHRPEDIYAY
jgi:hypothetical protein